VRNPFFKNQFSALNETHCWCSYTGFNVSGLSTVCVLRALFE
jgi:hypothetical protein